MIPTILVCPALIATETFSPVITVFVSLDSMVKVFAEATLLKTVSVAGSIPSGVSVPLI